MPHDLFGEAVVRPRARTPVGRTLTVVSIVFHAAVLSAVVVAQLFAVGPLPAVRRALDFQYTVVAPVEPPLPRRVAPSTRTIGATEPPNAAPSEIPRGITPETGFENAATPVESVGVERGVTSFSDIGRVESAAPPPPPMPAQPVRLHSGIQPPQKIADIKPIYPTIAQSARVQGVVILEAIIDVTGNVESVKVLRSIPLLDQAAVEAVRQWRYTPARLNGQPVPVIVTVTVNFAIDR